MLMRSVLVWFCFLILMVACTTPGINHAVVDSRPSAALQQKIDSLCNAAAADVGVFIIGPESDSVIVHPNKPYRMMSVAKFPQALKILSMIQSGELPEDYQFLITADDMKQRTFSMLPEDHPVAPFNLSVAEVLGYAVGQSDNVTSNRMFEVAGGPDSVEQFIKSFGIRDIGIQVDYWHLNNETAYDNWSTPRAMALLLEKFYQGKILDETHRQILLEAMISGPSGKNRIKGLLPEGVRVAHKTGTGNTDDATGRIMALNDVGIIELKDNRHITLAIFVSDSFEGVEGTERLIADIAKTSVDYYMVK